MRKIIIIWNNTITWPYPQWIFWSKKGSFSSIYFEHCSSSVVKYKKLSTQCKNYLISETVTKFKLNIPCLFHIPPLSPNILKPTIFTAYTYQPNLAVTSMPSSALCLLWEKLPRSGIIIDFGSLVSNVHRFGDPSIRFVLTKTQDFGTHSEVIVGQIRVTQGGMVTERCVRLPIQTVPPMLVVS